MRIKSWLLSLVAVLALAPLAHAADVSITLTNVHLCCQKCVDGANKTVAKVDGATAAPDKTARTIVITAPDTATAQKAVDALIKAGFYGGCSDESIKIVSETGAKGDKVQTLKVAGVHMCCPKCVKAVHEALTAVPGVTADTATKGVDTFEVTGDFKDSDVFAALQKAGLTGTCGQ
jgi:mercuric ion binding protein